MKEIRNQKFAKNETRICKISFGICSVSQIIQIETCLFFINAFIFHSFEDGNCVSNAIFK